MPAVASPPINDSSPRGVGDRSRRWARCPPAAFFIDHASGGAYPSARSFPYLERPFRPGRFEWRPGAARNPEKLKGLQAVFDVEAKKYNVYPLDSSFAERADPAIRTSLTGGPNVFTYYPGVVRIPEGSTPDVKNESYSVTADVEIPGGGANGVLATQGGRFGGWGFARARRQRMHERRCDDIFGKSSARTDCLYQSNPV